MRATAGTAVPENGFGRDSVQVAGVGILLVGVYIAGNGDGIPVLPARSDSRSCIPVSSVRASSTSSKRGVVPIKDDIIDKELTTQRGTDTHSIAGDR